jgi:hypothetical protein
MARAISLVSLLVTLLVVGWMLTAQHASNDRKTSQEIAQAEQSASGVSFQQAQTELEAHHALDGTYAGAALAGFGVTVARADASSYCIQDASSHLDGPGGTAAPGPC